eukprot:m.81088 g.81088  ORF g.81088 m.81088 type:complete len:539 (+) comp10970_c0_seq1:39-1655(+)
MPGPNEPTAGTTGTFRPTASAAQPPESWGVAQWSTIEPVPPHPPSFGQWAEDKDPDAAAALVGAAGITVSGKKKGGAPGAGAVHSSQPQNDSQRVRHRVTQRDKPKETGAQRPNAQSEGPRQGKVMRPTKRRGDQQKGGGTAGPWKKRGSWSAQKKADGPQSGQLPTAAVGVGSSAVQERKQRRRKLNKAEKREARNAKVQEKKRGREVRNTRCGRYYLTFAGVKGEIPRHCHEWEGRQLDPEARPFGVALANLFAALGDPNAPIVDDGASEAQLTVAIDNIVHSEQLQTAKRNMAPFVSLTDAQFDEQLAIFLRIIHKRALLLIEKHEELLNRYQVQTLSEENIGVWGSRRQWMFGSTLAELMLRYNVCEVELEPTLAVCFLPTGGIVGPGNTSLIRGDLQWATVTHAVVHDAFGYLGHCHNVGPGYNYLKTHFTLAPTTSPLSCQVAGIIKAWIILKRNSMYGAAGRAKRFPVIKRMSQIVSDVVDAVDDAVDDVQRVVSITANRITHMVSETFSGFGDDEEEDERNLDTVAEDNG